MTQIACDSKINWRGCVDSAKRWRQVAQDIPRFWRTIAIDPSKPTLSFEAVSSWLARSKNLPKTVHISARLCGKEMPYGYGTRKLCRGEARHFLGPVLVKVLKDGPLLDAVSIDCPSAECFQQLSDSLRRFNNRPKPSGWDTATTSRSQQSGKTNGSTSHPRCGSSSLSSLEAFSLHSRRYISPATPRGNHWLLISRRLYSTLKLTCDWSADHVLNLEVLSFDMGFGRFSSWNSGDTFMQRHSSIRCCPAHFMHSFPPWRQHMSCSRPRYDQAACSPRSVSYVWLRLLGPQPAHIPSTP